MRQDLLKESDYRKSVSIIQNLGELEVDGSSLSEFLKFREVSLWDLESPMWGAYNLPENFVEYQKRKFFSQKIKEMKSYGRTLRDYLREDFRIKKAGFFGSSNNSQVKILYLCFEPRQIYDFSPVADFLKKESNCGFIVLGSKHMANIKGVFEKYDMRFLAVEDFLMNIRYSAAENIKIFNKKIKKVIDTISSSSLKYKDIRVWDLLKNDLFNFAVYLGPRLIKDIEVARQIIEKEAPDIVVASDEASPRQRIYFFLSKLRNIPTLVIQQGYLSPKSVEWAFFVSDKMAVASEYSKHYLLKMGIEESKIYITGQPRFDYITKASSKKEEICQKFQINRDNKIVLFLSQPYSGANFSSSEARTKLISDVYKLAPLIQDCTFIIKPHPTEEMSLHKKLAKETGSKRIVLADKYDITQDLILGADVVLIYQSTTGIETLLAGKPLIVFDPEKNFDATFYVKSKMALKAGSLEELDKAIRLVLENRGNIFEVLKSERDKNLDHFIRNLDGKASERVGNLILKTI